MPAYNTPLGRAFLGGVRNPPALALAFKNALFAGGSDKTLHFYGDSTGNGQDEHFYLLVKALEANDLTHYIDYYLYNYPNSFAYIPMALLGRQSTYSIMQENFGRADGSVGTTSSGGQTWSANTWNISSGLGVPAATSNFLTTASALSSTSYKIQFDLKFPTSGSMRVYTLNTTKYLMFDISSVGAITANYFDGTTSTQIMSIAALGTTAGNMYTVLIVKDGLNVYVQIDGADLATIGGPRQLVGTLTSGQDSALTGRNVQFTAVASITGQAIDNIFVGNVTKPANRLLVRNASVSGTGFAFHETNIATEIPETPDLAVISLGMNEVTAPSQFVLDYATYVADIRAQAGANVQIVAEIQNPRNDAAPAPANMDARMAALYAACPQYGWDRIDAHGAFEASQLGIPALLDADGVHPNPLFGSPLWLATDRARFGV